MTVDVWVGLGVDTTEETCWLTIGDWHLDPQGERGDVAVGVWEGLDVYMELTVEDWVCWFTNGDWHLEPQGGERGEVVEVWGGLKPGMEAMLEDWVFWLIIGD